MDKLQMHHARLARLYAVAASGGTPDPTLELPAGKPTATKFIILAWDNAKKTGLELKRPRGPVDAPVLAGSIVELCDKMGVDAFTGLPHEPGRGATLEQVLPAYAPAEITDEELAPEPHRCRDAGGYCDLCLS